MRFRRSPWPLFALALVVCAFAVPSSAEGPAVTPGLGLVEAVRLMMAEDPNLAIEQSRLRSSHGVLLSSRGSFDPLIATGVTQEDTETPVFIGSAERLNRTTSGLGVTQLFRTGLSVAPGFSLVRIGDGDPGTSNVGTLSVTLRQPLLRGRGREVVAASEMSAERRVTASEMDLRLVVSARALSVVGQYWVARAAVLNLEILRESEERASELLETTRKLIDADVMPAADLVQVEANAMSKETTRIGAEQVVFEARQALGREIGLPPERIAGLPLPADAFPTVGEAELAALTDGDFWVRQALAQRADLQAARERRTAAEILRRAAERDLQPQLDLVFTPEYSGLVEGTGTGSYFDPLFRNVPGPSTTLALALSWPAGNRQARGDLMQLEEARQQSELVETLIARQIGADVPTALDAVARGAQQLARATEAVRLFERAVANEEKKLRAGSSTLIDVISQRDRLTSAQQSQVAAHLGLAVAVAQLRFETGSLIPAGDVREVEPNRLTTIPQTGGDE